MEEDTERFQSSPCWSPCLGVSVVNPDPELIDVPRHVETEFVGAPHFCDRGPPGPPLRQ